MLEHLFGSKTRLKLLRTFYRDPSRAYYVRELTRIMEAQINAVRRELEALRAAGLLKEIDRPADLPADAGAQLRKYYQLDTESILYPELHALLIKEKVLGEEQFIADMKNKGGEIKLFLLTGRFTQDQRAPSDMLLVGHLKERLIENLIKEYERDLGFEMRYTLMTEAEFTDRRHIMDKFIFTMFEAKHVKVVNSLGV